MTACPVCRSTNPRRVHEAREMMFGTRHRFHYGECGHCQLLWLLDPPTDFGPYYPPVYHGSQPGASGPRGRLGRLAKQWRDKRALTGRGIGGLLPEALAPNIRMRSLRPLSLTSTSRILDVGGGKGALVSALRALGFSSASGVDRYVDGDIPDPADGTPLVTHGTIESAPGSYDLIMFHHSFEHMGDPLAALRAARARLADGGTCVIRIPVFPSWAWDRYGVNWVQLDAPRHLCIHSVRSITALATEAGLCLRDTRWDSGSLQFWGSDRYEADIPLMEGPGGPPDRIDEWRLRRRAGVLNSEKRGDQAVFYLDADRSGPGS